MDNITTNRTILTANQDVPNIIDRHTATLTTGATALDMFGDTFAYGSNSYTTNLKSSGNNDWDIFMTDNSTGLTYTLPVVWFGDVTDNDGIVGHTYIDDDNGFLRINVEVQKLFGAITDTYAIYYVVYSTKINNELVL